CLFRDKIQVLYQDLPACFDLAESEVILHDCSFVKGDPEEAFASAYEVFEEVLTTGHQEHAYLEPQGMVADYRDGLMTVKGAMQCPFYIHNALKVAFGFSDREIRVVQATLGGGFGGKEDYPSVVGLQAALASYVTGHPVKLVLDRADDIRGSTKRHAAHMVFRTALDREGSILAMDVDIRLDGGAYLGISTTVIERSLVHCLGPYVVDNLRAYGTVRKTNQIVTGAFRGFGDPQSLFGIDTHMAHIALHLGKDSLAFRQDYLARQGDRTATNGIYRDPVPIRAMLGRAMELSDYQAKRQLYSSDQGRFRRGIGIGLIGRGCGFAGFAERDAIKAVVKLHKDEHDQVEALMATTDMGQGIHTSFSKVIAETIGIPMSHVICQRPDTQRVPNSGPTNASRSMQTVGRLLQRAAERLRDDWQAGKEQIIEECYRDERQPLVPWDSETFTGDGFVTYGWSVTVSEVTLDMLTAEVSLDKLWGVFDVGRIIDRNIVEGQMHGGMVQGYGYAALEKLEINQGFIQQDRFNNYIIPTAADIGDIHIEFHENPYPCGPFGAKGAAELPFGGVAPSYV
ncbi:MAG: molybdopterin-dependent oxidoreductase, partial [Firmicutes bacterium]|nr:molybdopterin-dependent oxidoreductase [Bacillota bacterium]